MSGREVPDLPQREDGTDGFGETLLAHHEGDTTYEILEREDGWIEANSVETYFSRYDDWPTMVQRAIDRVEGRVLDVGCGAGRHALYLQEQGHDVTAIDLSPGAVEVARDRGVEDVRRVDVANVADEFPLGTFETVIMLGNNFGLVGTAERAPNILRALATVSAGGADLLANSRDPTATDDEHHLAYHDLNRERGRLPGALRLRVRHEKSATDWFDYLLAAPDTMTELAGETPWTLRETIGPAEPLTAAGGDYVGVLER